MRVLGAHNGACGATVGLPAKLEAESLPCVMRAVSMETAQARFLLDANV